MYHVYLNWSAGVIYSFISSIFFLSNSKTLNFLSHFSVRPTKLKLDTHMGKGLIYCYVPGVTRKELGNQNLVFEKSAKSTFKI